jgi:predicted amino acid dehydrogenase
MEKRRLARFRAMTRNVKTSTTIALWVCLLAAIGLYVASFLVPPMGEIHPSVLKAGSWIFAFAGLAELREAVQEGLGFKLTHGDTTVVVQDLDSKPAPPPPPADPEEETQIEEG